MPTTGNTVRHFTSDSIDGTATGTHLIGTTVTDPNGIRKYHTLIVDVNIEILEDVATPAQISIGTNSPDWNNLVAAQSIGSGLLNIKTLALSADRILIEESTDIKCKVVSAAIGIPLCTPSCTFNATVFGIEKVFPNP